MKDFTSAEAGTPVRSAEAGTPVRDRRGRESPQLRAETPDARRATVAHLRDGQVVTVREARPSDAPAIEEFLSGLGLEARRLRFFTGGIDIARMAHSIAPGGADRIGLVSRDAAGAIVGHALCIELGRGRAEIALEVADQLHGLGLGTILVERLAELAERRGVSTLVAQVLPENRPMLDVLRDGFDAHVKWADGVDEVEFPTASWRLARGRYSAMFAGGTKPAAS